MQKKAQIILQQNIYVSGVYLYFNRSLTSPYIMHNNHMVHSVLAKFYNCAIIFGDDGDDNGMDEDDVLQILILTTVGLSLSLFDTAAGFTGQLEAASSNHHTSTSQWQPSY